MGQARRFLPLQRGFDFFYGHGNNGIDYYTHERYGVPSLFRGNKRTTEDRGRYITDVFGREAVTFLKSHLGNRPVFLYLAFNAPHGASTLADDNDGQKPGVQAPEDEVAPYRSIVKNENLARYYGAVTRMDRAIGDVLKTVADAGQTDNTLVLFLSDNGGSGNGGNAPLKGAKSTMWEGGLRVPFIVRWPQQIPAGRTTNEFLTSLEIVPTLLEAMDAEPPAGVKLDGENMLPVLQGSAAAKRKEMFWQRRSDKAARIDHWKWLDSARGKGLFDLSTDLGETHDLSAEQPEIVFMMQERFAAWQKEMEAAEPRGPFRDY
jgi:arylsulfatase A-like enzyme